MKTYDFHYPLFLTFLQLVISEIFIVFTGIMSAKFRYHDVSILSDHSMFSIFAPLEWDWAIASHVFPLSAVWLVMLAASNICLRYSEITFYQVRMRSVLLITRLFVR